ncbi:MAG: hypothetical protein AB9880_01530 [Christensenellales bacterium]
MERSIYFDGWHKHNYCQHPGLPMRSLHMLDDLERLHATMLVWAGLGGGSISLPYLHHEAFGPVDVRQGMFGYMNDQDFIRECSKRGINVFAIVFEVQGWEFPAVIDPQSGRIQAINKLAEQQEAQDWYGLREFSQDKYPHAFPTSLKDYYPQGIVNSDGEAVTDLWEECAARRLDGSAVHAQWVEVKDHLQQCYQNCRNNPVWRGYLKQVIKLMIDAGAPGIQLDEAELPITAIGSGGCFCKDCMKQFTAHLQERRAQGLLGPEWDGIDLAGFSYKDYLLAHHPQFPKDAPFFRDYWEFQVRAVKRYFSELVDYAKAYSRETLGREVLMSGNFFNLMPCYFPIVPKVDVIITEMEHTQFRQPHFYRYCEGFARGRSVAVAENPYGGIVPDLARMLDKGRGYDLYRIFLLEASMYGCNMSVPYGGWMGNTIHDSFWPPMALSEEVQGFLKQQEHVFRKEDKSDVCVLYSYLSYYWRETAGGSGGANAMQQFTDLADITASGWDGGKRRTPFWEVIKTMSDQQAVYDVRMMADGDLLEDTFTLEEISGYPLVVLPDCDRLTAGQQEILLAYAQAGGKVLAHGRLAEGTDLLDRLAQTGNLTRTGNADAFDQAMGNFRAGFLPAYAPWRSVQVSDTRLGVHRVTNQTGTYIHLMNYEYDAAADHIRRSTDVVVKTRARGKVSVHTPDGKDIAFTAQDDKVGTTIRLDAVPVYLVIALTAGEDQA